MTGLVDRVAADIRTLRYNLYLTDGSSAEVRLEDLVRDVLRAMREPTAAMIATGLVTNVRHSWGLGEDFIEDPEDIWRAMIDEAVKS